MEITILSTATGILSDLASAHDKFSKTIPGKIDLHLYEIQQSLSDEETESIKQSFSKSGLIVLDLRLSPDAVLKKVSDLMSQLDHAPDCISFMFPDKNLIPHFSFGKIKLSDMFTFFKESQFKGNLFALSNSFMARRFSSVVPAEMQGDISELIQLVEYWTFANENHMTAVLQLIARKYYPELAKVCPKPAKPAITDRPLIFDIESNETFETLTDYAESSQFNQAKPTISVFYLGYNFKASQVSAVGQIIEKLKSFANVIPIFVPGVSGMKAEDLETLTVSEHFKTNLIINFIPFRLGAGPMGGNTEKIMPFIESLNVPILHPFFMTDVTVEDWQHQTRGVHTSEYLVSVMLPELDGATDTFPVGAMQFVENEQGYGFMDKKLVLIEDRVERLVERSKNILKLQQLKNSDKKVAILCYNYPPGEGSIFGGSFLDTFASVENIMKDLYTAGYDTSMVSKSELMETFSAGKMLNSGQWTQEVYDKMLRYKVTDYKKQVEGQTFYQPMCAQVGQAPGNTMVDNGDFLIPGKLYDSVFIGLQPARTVEGDVIDTLHDQSLYPHHQYVAYYTWLKEEFKADVIVHVGTHGTLEFLKGKEVGLSGECMPDVLIGNTPHLYLYYVGNPSEAMIAKRRTHATIVSYQTPAYDTSDLYESYVDLEDLLANYEEAKRIDPKRCESLLKDIERLATELNFSQTNIHDIEIELYRIKQSLIPRGLHVFGEGYGVDDAERFMKYVLRYDRAGAKSLKNVIAESKGLDYHRLLEQHDQAQLEHLETIEDMLIQAYIKTQDISKLITLSDTQEKEAYKALEFGMKAYVNSQQSEEMSGLLDGLDGKYIKAKLASDIVKNPDILPTGSNLYQFDPRQIPEQNAAERGKEIAENTLKIYQAEHGNYPLSTGVVLWGFETSRTQGETIGQILHYLGVKIVPAKFGFKNNFEIIPLSELKRPRIDVVVHMTGFFRDIFPSVLDELNKIIAKVAKLDEAVTDNYVHANYVRVKAEMLQAGYDENDADLLASSRIFGPKEGAYSTRMTDMIEGGSWESESELAAGYSQDIHYIYAPGFRGEAAPDLLQSQLKAVDIVSQIRSNLEYEVTDIDHYYEFFGGFQKAVEAERGLKVPVLISDTTGETVLTENVAQSIERGVRTRVLNPKWIDGLLAHEYHGTSKILERFENLIGLAATTNEVKSWVFSDLNKTYVADEKRKDQLKADNPWAYHHMLERLFESNQRGYWDATDEELQQLKETYLEIEGSIEEKI